VKSKEKRNEPGTPSR